MSLVENAMLELHQLDSTVEVDPNTISSYSKPVPTSEEVLNDIESNFLKPTNKLSWDLLDIFQTKDFQSLSLTSDNAIDLFIEKSIQVPPSMSKTSVRFQRKGINGVISKYEEKYDKSLNTDSLSNSISLNRKFDGNTGGMIQGNTSNLPFQPGGLVSMNINDAEKKLIKNDQGLYCVAPGLSRGMEIGQIKGKFEIASVEEIDDDDDDEVVDKESLKNANTIDKDLLVKELKDGDGDDIDMLIPEIPSNINLTNPMKLRGDWAHIVDLDHKIDNFQELVPNMARTWPFELDTFQKEAVFHLEQGDSVFVAAHTSAGKTVVAEYAIAMANRNMTKCIYTSPIKLLSNQKFRDFKDDGQDVGLITGDVQINPDANCLIMTTEILRSMLYRGADLIRDVEFVIFDEVHYVNNIDRGVVWEEVIIMLPDHIKFILLSATVPNTVEFASWIGRTKHKDIYVISTPKRPVPLEIFVWAKNDVYKIVDAKRDFQQIEWQKHVDLLEKPKLANSSQSNDSQRGGRGGARGGARGSNLRGGRGGRGVFTPLKKANNGNRFGQRDAPNKGTWINLVKYLNAHNLLPMVTFVFSKKRCEDYCDTLSSVEFTNHREKSEIHMFINRSISVLKKEDRELPQILKMREMLLRGIAVHHSGLLPIVKECVEILFAKSLVKVLFATETFAMGLNLPTRTVVFSELRKHDGRAFRDLLPGEFTQMAGRAGRRGLDTTGTVIIMTYNNPISRETLTDVTLGMPTKLQSQFRLTYNMILNLLRVEALRVEEMIRRSFSENSSQSLLPQHKKAIISLESKLNEISVDKCDSCNEEEMNISFSQLMEYKKLNTEIISTSLELHSFPYIVGRLIVYRDDEKRIKPGFLIKNKAADKKFVVIKIELTEDLGPASDIPYLCTIPGFIARFFPKKMVFDPSKPLEFVEINYTSVEFVSLYCLKTSINDLINGDKKVLEATLNEIKIIMKFQQKWKECDYNKKSKLVLHELIQSRAEVIEYLTQDNALKCPHFEEHFNQLHLRLQLEEQINLLKSLVKDDNLELLPDYEQRLSVLKKLGFVDDNLNVVLKGRVACEINSGWELALTELILNNFLSDFSLEEIIALLSVFVYEGKNNSDEEPAITPRLDAGKKKIKEIMTNLIKVYTEFQIPLTQEEEEFLDRKRFNLMNVVYEWSRGMTFNEIMKISSEAEGTIVRVITRLDEICREVKNAALIIGDNSLHSKMSEAQEKIKRDIVFCASLYL